MWELEKEALEGWEKASIGKQLRNWAKRYQDQVAVADEKDKGIIKLAKPVAYIVAEKYLGYDYLPMARKQKKTLTV